MPVSYLVPTSPGAYIRSCREAAGLSIADVAARVATTERMAEHARAEWIAQIEAGAPASFNTIVALLCAFPFDLTVLGELAAIEMGELDVPLIVTRTCSCACANPVAIVDAIHAAARGGRKATAA